MRKSGKRIVNMTLLMPIIMGILISCVSVFVMESYAADTRIATMDGESYWNYNTLVSDLEAVAVLATVIGALIKRIKTDTGE